MASHWVVKNLQALKLRLKRIFMDGLGWLLFLAWVQVAIFWVLPLIEQLGLTADGLTIPWMKTSANLAVVLIVIIGPPLLFRLTIKRSSWYGGGGGGGD